ncbi:MAG TPA: hypothetical protein VK622_05005 [Puia sp.]|nr:hypothetical protein [Puia sp.]
MATSNNYHKRLTWKYPPGLSSAIIESIRLYYSKLEHKYENFSLPETYKNLTDYIGQKTGIKIPLRWMKDFYTNQKHNTEIKRKFFEALLMTFNYDFNSETGEYRLKNYGQVPESDNETEGQGKILSLIAGKCRKHNKVLQLFVGKYKYFLGARKNSIYDYIYENELEVFSDGEVHIYNPFSKQHYHGLTVLRNETTLQILSFDLADGMIEGVGNLLSFKINLYGRMAIFIPGIGLSFDAELRPIATQALLCCDLTLTKKNKPVRDYFDKLAVGLRLNCPETDDVKKLLAKYPSLFPLD